MANRRRRRQTKPSIDNVKAWEWTKRIGSILAVLLPLIWVVVDNSIEAILTLVGITITVLTSWQLKKAVQKTNLQ